MAPSRTATVKSKHAANKSGIRNSKTSTKKAGNDGIVKNRSEKSKRTQSKGVSLKQTAREKGKGAGLATLKKKRRVYTEKELDIPKLNMITPVGVEKPKGKKKGKVFVDDKVGSNLMLGWIRRLDRMGANKGQESMLTILAMVNADKDGQIESKMMKARQMEEIREARKAEAEKRVEVRKAKLEETKDGIRKKRKKLSGDEGKDSTRSEAMAGTKPLKLKKKTVSFA